MKNTAFIIDKEKGSFKIIETRPRKGQYQLVFNSEKGHIKAK